MSKRFLALVSGLFLLASPAALAADNLAGVQGNSSKTPYTQRTKDLGNNVHMPATWLLDLNGVPLGTSSNPLYMSMPGAATDARLEAVRALLAAALNVNLPTGAATDAKVEAVRALLAGGLNINNWPVVQAISALALPLPTGAATDAKLEALRLLLAGPLTTNLPAGAATDTKLEAVRALLAAPLSTNLPAGAATDAKLEALRLLLAAPLSVNLPTGAATDTKLEAVRALLAAPLSTNLPTGAATDAKLEALRLLLAAPLSVNVAGGAIQTGTPGNPSVDIVSMQGVDGGKPVVTAATPNRPATTATDTGVTVTTTSAQVLAANATRNALALINNSGVDFGCKFGTGPAVIGGAGSFDLPARVTRTWTASYMPTAPVHCVSASGSGALTIQTN